MHGGWGTHNISCWKLKAGRRDGSGDESSTERGNVQQKGGD